MGSSWCSDGHVNPYAHYDDKSQQSSLRRDRSFLSLLEGATQKTAKIFHRVLTKDELWHYLPLLSHKHKTLLLNPPLLLKDRNIPEVAKFKRQCIKNLLELEILFKDTIASDHGKWTITKATSEDIAFFYSKVKKKG